MRDKACIMRKNKEQNSSSLFKEVPVFWPDEGNTKKYFLQFIFSFKTQLCFAKLPKTTQTIDTSKGKTLNVSIPL